MFGVTAVVATCTYIMFQVFGTSDIQAWNYPPKIGGYQTRGRFARRTPDRDAMAAESGASTSSSNSISGAVARCEDDDLQQGRGASVSYDTVAETTKMLANDNDDGRRLANGRHPAMDEAGDDGPHQRA